MGDPGFLWTNLTLAQAFLELIELHLDEKGLYVPYLCVCVEIDGEWLPAR